MPDNSNPSLPLQNQSWHVLHYLLDNTSPKESSLSLETELERAIDEIAECFVVEEDDETDGPEEADDDAQQQQDRKTLQSVSGRICVALDSHRRVLDHLTFKSSRAGILVIQGFLKRLEDFLVDLMQAINEGETLPPSSSAYLCTAVASWCQHAFMWTSKLATTSEELDLLREALDKLGMSPESYSKWMHRGNDTSFDDRLVFFPLAALILTSWQLADELEGHPGNLPDDARPDDNTFADILSMSMPLLGSALNGLAKDGGHLWIWYLVHQMKGAQQNADLDEVSMLLELLMPNLAGDPSEVSRYALHRLTSALISLVREAKDRIALFQQLISTENLFLSVRLSSLALLREQIAAAIRSHEIDSILHHDSFWSKLAPLVFVLPTSNLPLHELPLEAALQDRVIPWSMESAKIMLLLLSCGLEVEESCKAYIQQNQTLARWILPLKECLARWEGEASSDTAIDMDITMLLYSLRWTVEQMEGRLNK
ncbi:hypothetical protein QFC22_005421 [Naganishia vaughanmartiniae]|uniref:Uncharacterized protein n=1 Tax=Naganishia vaughanmartiniae TaxID=1424756 RepID=A0ACC2WUB4_9TREE|nr:hypothetical protein QFC22_005421 [Naganishia vaughanmartiniae]